MSAVFECMALAFIIVGCAKAFVSGMRAELFPRAGDEKLPLVWVQLSRTLVAALTFQLAADLARTAFAPSWNEIGKLAAIAAIRTFLSYFLERDLRAIQYGNRTAAPVE